MECEEYYKRILASEPAVLADDPSSRHRKAVPAIPARHAPNKHRTGSLQHSKRVDTVLDDAESDTESLPSLALSQMRDQEPPKHSQLSQLSWVDGFGTEDDLPDVTSLIDEMKDERKPSRRRNRVIVEDDSDE